MSINTSFKVPKKFVILMDNLIEKGTFNSRREFIESAIMDYMEYYFSSQHELEKNEEIYKEDRLASKSIDDFI